MTVIRFPAYADLRERKHMAVRLPWHQRLMRKLFGKPSGVNLARRRMDRARREVIEQARHG